VLRSLVNSESGGRRKLPGAYSECGSGRLRGTKFDTAYTENVIRPGYQGCDRYTDVSVYQGTVQPRANREPQHGEDVGAGYESDFAVRPARNRARPLAMTGAGFARQRGGWRTWIVRQLDAGFERRTATGVPGVRAGGSSRGGWRRRWFTHHLHHRHPVHHHCDFLGGGGQTWRS